MKLQNAHLAIVERHKVVAYLLNSAHPDNGGKALFFGSLGFSAAAPEALIDALRMLARNGDVVDSVKSDHGQKHVVEGVLESQTKRDVGRVVRTVWIVDRGMDAPRLVTAYPARNETLA